MDSSALNLRLRDRLPDVVLHLFPAAKVRGNVAHIGGIEGDKGDSMAIDVSGPRAGRFVDYANPEVKGASALMLWSRARGVSYSVAVKEAKEWLGIRDDDYGISANKPKRTYSQPERERMRLAESNSPAMDYLTITRRIDPIVVCRYKIAETGSGEELVFPYLEPGKKEPVHFQFLRIERGPDGKKSMRSSKDTKPILWGMTTISDNTSSLVITEGQIDALSWASLGVEAVSMPGGVGNLDWIDLNWEWLERFEEINLSFDMDEPGQDCAQKVAKRLGIHRCRIVKLPHKDANECLLAGANHAAAQLWLATAATIDLAEIQAPSHYLDEVWRIFNPKDGEEGYITPWYPKLPLRIRPAEVTVLSGFSGHGKTCWINHLIISLIQQGAKVLDCSLEIKPPRTLQWMARQALAKRKPDNEGELKATLEWLSHGVWLFDYVGTANVPRMLEAMLYAVKRYGVNIIFIDSLFKCGIGSDDYNGQKEFIARLCDFARDTGVHVFIVAHTRKPPVNTRGANEDRVPSKDEISGSSDIQNGAFNVIIIWRNKEKQRKLDEQRALPVPNLEAVNKLLEAPDGRIKLDKNRFDGTERELAVWFDPHSTQFTAERGQLPFIYFRHAT